MNSPCGHIEAECVIGNFWKCAQCNLQAQTEDHNKYSYYEAFPNEIVRVDTSYGALNIILPKSSLMGDIVTVRDVSPIKECSKLTIQADDKIFYSEDKYQMTFISVEKEFGEYSWEVLDAEK